MSQLRTLRRSRLHFTNFALSFSPFRPTAVLQHSDSSRPFAPGTVRFFSELLGSSSGTATTFPPVHLEAPPPGPRLPESLPPPTLAAAFGHMAQLSVDYPPISYITHTSDEAGYSSVA